MLNLVEHNSLEDWWSISSCKLRSSEPEKANFTFISLPSTHRQALGRLHEPFQAERMEMFYSSTSWGSPSSTLSADTWADAEPLLKPCWEQFLVNPFFKVYLRSPFGTFWPQGGPSSGCTLPVGLFCYLAVLNTAGKGPGKSQHTQGWPGRKSEMSPTDHTFIFWRVAFKTHRSCQRVGSARGREWDSPGESFWVKPSLTQPPHIMWSPQGLSELLQLQLQLALSPRLNKYL